LGLSLTANQNQLQNTSADYTAAETTVCPHKRDVRCGTQPDK